MICIAESYIGRHVITCIEHLQLEFKLGYVY
jgi:hypothetical protein